MFTHALSGGLGNQLFQIFATIAVSLKYNDSFHFTDRDRLTDAVETWVTPRHTYWNHFLAALAPFTRPDSDSSSNPVLIDLNRHDYVPVEVPDHDPRRLYELKGYYQSYKFFETELDEICALLRIPAQIRDLPPPSGEVSMHFRVGDYRYYPNYHPILPYEYYRDSLADLLTTTERSGVRVVYFCEDADRELVEPHVVRLQDAFPGCEFARAPGDMPDYRQMLWMSTFPYNILANSTFSLWAAYLNRHPGRIVWYPSQWFGRNMTHFEVSDMFMPGWKRTFVA